MTNIIQLDYSELQQAIKTCVAEAIAEISVIPKQQPLQDRCSLAEAMVITGLSDSQLYKMTSLGTIPFEKYGKRLQFSRRALAQWIEERTMPAPTSEEIMSRKLAKTAKRRMAQ